MMVNLVNRKFGMSNKHEVNTPQHLLTVLPLSSL
jgi:hypothetical protein